MSDSASIRFIVGCLLTVFLLQPVASAENTTITLINGVAVEGNVLDVLEAGLKVKVGRSTKTYPWYALSSGTRFKFDPKYRMNLDGYLAGDEVASLTNPADPDYDPMNPDEGGSAQADEGVSATGPLNFTAYQNPDTIVPVKIPAFSVMTLDGYEASALQYGPKPNDVIVSAFSPDNPPRLIMLDMNKSGMVNEDASKREIDGTDYFSYARKTVAADVGDIKIEQRVQWLVRKDKPGKRYVHTEVDLSRGNQKASFILSGAPRGFGQSKEVITPKALLVEPAISFTIIIEDEKTFLVGKVRMGRFILIPREGMDLKLRLKITDSNGRLKFGDEVAFEADGAPSAYPIKIDISRFAAGKQYKTEAHISLGAFLGDVSHEEIFLMPDAMKL